MNSLSLFRKFKNCIFLILSAMVLLGNCQLYPGEVEEGTGYIYPQPVPANLEFSMTLANNPNREGFYVPMGSQHLYRAYASYLLGHPPKNQMNLDSMNLHIKYFQPLNQWITSGYDERTFTQFCAPKGSIYKQSCLAGFGSQGTNLQNIRETVDTLVYANTTSKNSVFLFTRCVMGHENDWKVLSIKPSIDSKTRKIISNKIVELGYNVSNVMNMNYE